MLAYSHSTVEWIVLAVSAGLIAMLALLRDPKNERDGASTDRAPEKASEFTIHVSRSGRCSLAKSQDSAARGLTSVWTTLPLIWHETSPGAASFCWSTAAGPWFAKTSCARQRSARQAVGNVATG